MSRLSDLDRFYSLLEELRRRLGSYRFLSSCSSSSGWPDRGTYFFFEDGEARQASGTLRVVRVGTHALKCRSKSTLWGRLSSHRGTLGGGRPGGGNHRGSIFRKHVGTALLSTGDYPQSQHQSWGRGSSAKGPVRETEFPLEKDVSGVIGRMPLLWVDVPDEPGPSSARHHLEAGAIGLLSNFQRPAIDSASPGWLGRAAKSAKVRESGLWNVDHVDNGYDPAFLDLLDECARKAGG